MTSLLFMNNTPDPLETTIHRLVQSRNQPWDREPKFLYRYEIYVESYDGGDITSRVYENAFPVIRQTPACWVIDHWGKTRYVLKSAHKRFAYPDLENALNSLRKRTAWRKRHAKWAMTKAEHAEELLEKVFPRPVPAGVPIMSPPLPEGYIQ